MKRDYDFEDFKSIIDDELGTGFFDHSDEQLRQIWADNICEWSETHSRKELLEGLRLLTDYSNAYQDMWENSWLGESFGKVA